ncbi:glutathione peroxidase [Bacteriovoracaceae bacterium]|nr:glutathione peroxidase [Bacteriovoracaceae bacterium]
MIYDINVTKGNGEIQSLSEFKNKVLLIVNTASKCGFTPQYDGLEELYVKYKDQGFEILGFPCNQFGGQEPGSDEEIANFCKLNHGVTFPIYSKIEVNGDNTHELYELLKTKAPGLLGSKKIKWNFTKFLVSSDGKTIERFASTTKPANMINDIAKLLLHDKI